MRSSWKNRIKCRLQFCGIEYLWHFFHFCSREEWFYAYFLCQVAFKMEISQVFDSIRIWKKNTSKSKQSNGNIDIINFYGFEAPCNSVTMHKLSFQIDLFLFFSFCYSLKCVITLWSWEYLFAIYSQLKSFKHEVLSIEGKNINQFRFCQ